MNRRILTALAAATLLIIPAASSATSTAARTGSFDAMGTGALVAEGKLRVFGTIDGTVLVRDRFGGAIVKIDGKRQKPRRVKLRGRVHFVYTLRKVDGSFFARGLSIKIELRSAEETLSVSAFGRGKVTALAGEGTYHTNGGEEQAWSSALVPIEIAPPKPQPKVPTPTPPDDGAQPS